MSSLLVRLPLALIFYGCASSPYPDIDEPMPPGAGSSLQSDGLSRSPRAAPAIASGGPLERADVERVIDAGLGRFLTHVTLEPSLVSGKFRGWSIVTLRPPELWNGVDLQPGDVVTQINGMPIERETQAFDAFQAVRHAEKLEVSYLRQGQPRTLRYAILGKPSKALPAAPAAAKPGESSKAAGP